MDRVTLILIIILLIVVGIFAIFAILPDGGATGNVVGNSYLSQYGGGGCGR